MELFAHVKEVLKINTAPAYWPKMILCSLATTLPLLVGVLTGHLVIASFGALVGFTLVLNDHFGQFGHRLWIITLTYFILLAGLSLGVFLQGHVLLAALVLFIISYWAGLMGGNGAELERAVIFAVFQFLAGFYSPVIGPAYSMVVLYSLVGYVSLVICAAIIVVLRGHNPNPYSRVRVSLRYVITAERSRHFYAISYAVAVLACWCLVEILKLDHGYWAIGTILLIMRPDATQSVYRSVQRFFGTLLGVIVADILILSLHSPIPIVAAIAFFSIFTPWSLARSYWLGSAIASVCILLILDLPSLTHGDLQTPLLRLQATALGCGITILMVAFWKWRPAIGSRS
ncbi:FUSC family protein [Bdellovibrio sp. HCB2-146]|uniref:FUSC family protein n=1 Tax=Bdellovibrio sp. HCB2-146 TaxID=3394362 RepID=UPI0039BD36E3